MGSRCRCGIIGNTSTSEREQYIQWWSADILFPLSVLPGLPIESDTTCPGALGSPGRENSRLKIVLSIR